MISDRSLLYSPDEKFYVELMESPERNFWQLFTTLPEAFTHCHKCNEEFKPFNKKMFCKRYNTMFCENCDKTEHGCASGKDKEGHEHYNISKIETIMRAIQ